MVGGGFVMTAAGVVGGATVVGGAVVGMTEPVVSALLVSEAEMFASDGSECSGVLGGETIESDPRSESANTNGVWPLSGGVTAIASAGDRPAIFTKVVAPRAVASSTSATPTMPNELRSLGLVCSRLTTTVRSEVGPGTEESSWGCLMTTGSADPGVGGAGLFNCSSNALQSFARHRFGGHRSSAPHAAIG